MPAAGWELHTSARLPRQVLRAAGFMALEWAELSRAAARRSDRAASDIAERARAVPSSVGLEVLEKSHAVGLGQVRAPNVSAISVAGFARIDETVL
jgi:hypothetical protein